MEKSKIKIDIKNIFGEILFSFEKENNILVDTLLEALKNNADLIYADLRYVDLGGSNLINANLRGADLRGSNLRNSNLRGADLGGSNLRNSNLCNANLRGADLGGANLCNANLRYVDLGDANLRNSNLCNANLRGADLGGANFYNANLRDADLNFVNLNNAYLGKKEKNRFGRILKKKIIVYKKCVDETIVKLEIPKGAIVFSINNKKYRTNIAKVLQIDDAEGNKINQTVSNYDQNFKYKTGKTIEIKDFDLMYNVECGAGIHFFKTKKEAQEEPNYIQIKKSKKGEEK